MMRNPCHHAKMMSLALAIVLGVASAAPPFVAQTPKGNPRVSKRPGSEGRKTGPATSASNTQTMLPTAKHLVEITQYTLQQVKSAGVPDEIIRQLSPLEDQLFVGTDSFLSALQKAIGIQPAAMYQTTILQSATLPHPPHSPMTDPPLFEVTAYGLEQMQAKGVPADVTGKLEPILNQEYIGANNFLNALNNSIGEAALAKQQTRILAYTILPKTDVVFKITTQNLQKMQAAGVPADLIRKVTPLINQEFFGLNNYLDALKQAIGGEIPSQCQPTFVQFGLYASALGHPYAQTRLAMSVVKKDGDTTTITTGNSIFPEPVDPATGQPVDPFTRPPGTNFLPTIYTNAFDGLGNEIPNTLPSTPTNPYNLHDGDPVVSQINRASPTDDLRGIFAAVTRLASKREKEGSEVEALRRDIEEGIDILEGYPVAQRLYSGFPLLHYTGPEKVKKVIPVLDTQGQTVGGNVNVRQIWYDSHIESDTAFVDPSAVMNVPWTVTYTVDVLNRGEDDFSPFVMYVDPSFGSPLPHVAMDQSFFPIGDGTRTLFKIKMAPGKYFNLTYTWGWRMHPPRVQVFENANKKISLEGEPPKTLVQWEQSVFCNPQSICETGEPPYIRCKPDEPRYDLQGNPTPCEQRVISIIQAKIGEAAPEKQMWRALHDAREAARDARNAASEDARQRNYKFVLARIVEAQSAFEDWRDRTRLPQGDELMNAASNATLVSQLDGATLPDALRQTFAASKYPLSGQIKVSVLNRGSAWLVSDELDGPRYTIRLKENQFSIYRGIFYGVDVDKSTDLTLLYVNNTLYGELSDRSNNIADSIRIDFSKWGLRNTRFAVTIYNGDFFEHGYQNVDFGGARGWENQFKSSVKVGGSGCWFTFGRVHWWMNIPNDPPAAGSPDSCESNPHNPMSGDLAVVIKPASIEPYTPGRHKVVLNYQYEPSRRLRLYQFDPIHHDVAVLSLH